jgi:hypothetical protein
MLQELPKEVQDEVLAALPGAGFKTTKQQQRELRQMLQQQRRQQQQDQQAAAPARGLGKVVGRGGGGGAQALGCGRVGFVEQPWREVCVAVQAALDAIGTPMGMPSPISDQGTQPEAEAGQGRVAADPDSQAAAGRKLAVVAELAAQWLVAADHDLEGVAAALGALQDLALGWPVWGVHADAVASAVQAHVRAQHGFALRVRRRA